MEEKNIKRGKKARKDGKAFELKVRKDLEAKGWIVDKWSNNVKDNVLIQAKPKFAGPGRPMMLGAGFPDFVAFQKTRLSEDNKFTSYVIGVEVKSNRYLKPEEKEKCRWLIDNNVFSKILIAFKNTLKGTSDKGIEYKEFE